MPAGAGGGNRGPRPFQEVTHLHQFPLVRQILAARSMQRQRLPVPRDLQVPFVILNGLGIGHRAEHRPHLPPLEVMWHRVLEYALINLLVRAG